MILSPSGATQNLAQGLLIVGVVGRVLVVRLKAMGTRLRFLNATDSEHAGAAFTLCRPAGA